MTGKRMVPRFRGTVEFDNLAMTSDPFAFVISDEDYAWFAEGLSEKQKEEHMFLCVKDDMETYDFADAWRREYIAHATERSSHYRLYDAHEEALSLAAGDEYGYAGEIDLSPDNTQLSGDWKYAPFSKVLMQAEAMEFVAVYVLLSIYVSVISLAAAGIMSYVRSVTIAMDNRQLFEDLKKLGADDAYEERVIRVQLQKIFAWPVAAGCIAAGLFSLFLTYFNDMVLKPFEVRMLLMEMLLMALIASVLYGVYRAAYRRTKEIAGI